MHVGRQQQIDGQARGGNGPFVLDAAAGTARLGGLLAVVVDEMEVDLVLLGGAAGRDAHGWRSRETAQAWGQLRGQLVKRRGIEDKLIPIQEVRLELIVATSADLDEELRRGRIDVRTWS